MLQRVLTSLGAVGVHRVVVATDARGRCRPAWPTRSRRIVRTRDPPWPRVEFLDLPLVGGAADSVAATNALVRLGVRVLVVLGGDGTDRLVASACGEVPIAALSTGTNNAFAHLGEATVSGLAAGLLAAGHLAIGDACRRNKVLIVEHQAQLETGLGRRGGDDVVERRRPRRVEPERGHRALRHVRRAGVVGLSSIAALVRPVGRDEPIGLRLVLDPGAPRQVLAPIAPGLVREVGVASVEVLRAGDRRLIPGRGVVAVDGEREIEFRYTAPTVTLSLAGPWSIEVARTMAVAARRGLLCRPARSGRSPSTGRTSVGGSGTRRRTD